MPGTKTHQGLTRYALTLLKDLDIPISATDNLANDYCRYPDNYFTRDMEIHSKIAPYTFINENIQFHYLPDTPMVDLYRYWLPDPEKKLLRKSEPFHNRNFFQAKAGFEFYLNHAAECIRQNNADEGMKYLGCLLHMLQDSSFGIHSLEGPCGTDIFVLDRLFEEPATLKMRPTNILAHIDHDEIPIRTYLPQLLGASVPEIVACLYAHYAHAVYAARRICFTYVRNTYDGKEDANPALVQEMFYNAAELCVDVIFSVWSVALEKIDMSSCPASTSLTELEPFEFPLGGSGGYRFLSYVKNEAVSPSLEKIPLQLIMSGETVSFDSGISMGSHYEGKLLYWIPENVFSRFYACIGLHPEYLNPTGVKIELINDGNPVAEFLFNNEHPAEIIELNNPGGIFGFKFSYPAERACHCNNIIVIGNGFFQKKILK